MTGGFHVPGVMPWLLLEKMPGQAQLSGKRANSCSSISVRMGAGGRATCLHRIRFDASPAKP